MRLGVSAPLFPSKRAHTPFLRDKYPSNSPPAGHSKCCGPLLFYGADSGNSYPKKINEPNANFFMFSIRFLWGSLGEKVSLAENLSVLGIDVADLDKNVAKSITWTALNRLLQRQVPANRIENAVFLALGSFIF